MPACYASYTDKTFGSIWIISWFECIRVSFSTLACSYILLRILGSIYSGTIVEGNYSSLLGSVSQLFNLIEYFPFIS